MVTEEKYTQEIILLLDKYKTESKEKAYLHELMSTKNNRKHIIYNTISLILPLCLTFSSQIIMDADVNRYVSGGGFLIVGITNALLSFLNFKSKSKDHEFAQFNYSNISNNIELNLSRAEKFRTPADVTINTVKNELKNTDLYSPRTDGTCLSDLCCDK